jgi:hypothetical protein
MHASNSIAIEEVGIIAAKQFPRWKKNNSPMLQSFQVTFVSPGLEDMVIAPPWELILFGCSGSIPSQQYVLLSW